MEEDDNVSLLSDLITAGVFPAQLLEDQLLLDVNEGERYFDDNAFSKPLKGGDDNREDYGVGINLAADMAAGYDDLTNDLSASYNDFFDQYAVNASGDNNGRYLNDLDDFSAQGDGIISEMKSPNLNMRQSPKNNDVASFINPAMMFDLSTILGTESIVSEAEFGSVTKALDEAERERKEMKQKLLRRTELLELCRQSYLKDVIALKYALNKVITSEEKQMVLKQYTSQVPSLDLRGPLQLYAPKRTTLQPVHKCDSCGGWAELILHDSDEVDKLKAVIHMAKERENVMRINAVSMDTRMETQEKKHIEENRKHSVEKQVLYAEMKKIKEKFDSLDTENKRVREENKGMRDQVRSVKDENTFLNNAADLLREAEHNLTAEKEQHVELQLRYRKLVDEKTGLESEIVGLKNVVTEKKEAILKQKDQISEKNFVITERDVTIVGLNDRVNVLENSLVKANKAYVDIDMKFATFREESKDLLANAASEIEAAELKCEKLQLTINKCKQDVRDAQKAADDAMKFVEQSTKNLQDKDAELQNERDKLSKKDVQIEALHEEIGALKQFLVDSLSAKAATPAANDKGSDDDDSDFGAGVSDDEDYGETSIGDMRNLFAEGSIAIAEGRSLEKHKPSTPKIENDENGGAAKHVTRISKVGFGVKQPEQHGRDGLRPENEEVKKMRSESNSFVKKHNTVIDQASEYSKAINQEARAAAKRSDVASEENKDDYATEDTTDFDEGDPSASDIATAAAATPAAFIERAAQAAAPAQRQTKTEELAAADEEGLGAGQEADLLSHEHSIGEKERKTRAAADRARVKRDTLKQQRNAPSFSPDPATDDTALSSEEPQLKAYSKPRKAKTGKSKKAREEREVVELLPPRADASLEELMLRDMFYVKIRDGLGATTAAKVINSLGEEIAYFGESLTNAMTHLWSSILCNRKGLDFYVKVQKCLQGLRDASRPDITIEDFAAIYAEVIPLAGLGINGSSKLSYEWIRECCIAQDLSKDLLPVLNDEGTEFMNKDYSEHFGEDKDERAKKLVYIGRSLASIDTYSDRHSAELTELLLAMFADYFDNKNVCLNLDSTIADAQEGVRVEMNKTITSLQKELAKGEKKFEITKQLLQQTEGKLEAAVARVEEFDDVLYNLNETKDKLDKKALELTLLGESSTQMQMMYERLKAKYDNFIGDMRMVEAQLVKSNEENAAMALSVRSLEINIALRDDKILSLNKELTNMHERDKARRVNLVDLGVQATAVNRDRLVQTEFVTPSMSLRSIMSSASTSNESARGGKFPHSVSTAEFLEDPYRSAQVKILQKIVDLKRNAGARSALTDVGTDAAPEFFDDEDQNSEISERMYGRHPTSVESSSLARNSFLVPVDDLISEIKASPRYTTSVYEPMTRNVVVPMESMFATKGGKKAGKGVAVQLPSTSLMPVKRDTLDALDMQRDMAISDSLYVQQKGQARARGRNPPFAFEASASPIRLSARSALDSSTVGSRSAESLSMKRAAIMNISGKTKIIGSDSLAEVSKYLFDKNNANR